MRKKFLALAVTIIMVLAIFPAAVAVEDDDVTVILSYVGNEEFNVAEIPGFYMECAVGVEEFDWYQFDLGDFDDLIMTCDGEIVEFDLGEDFHYGGFLASDDNYYIYIEAYFIETFTKDGEYVLTGTYKDASFETPVMTIGAPMPADGGEDEEPEEIPAEKPVWNGPASAMVAPTASKILVDGEYVDFDAYLIGQNNFFKLRDIALILTEAQSNMRFSVGYDAEANAISLTSGDDYVPNGIEFAPKGEELILAEYNTTTKILVDGEEVSFTIYAINGNNYFMLRDIGRTFDFNVSWTGSEIVIATDEPYDEN